MKKRLLSAFAIASLASAVLIAQQPASNLRIVVIAGEGAVNIIQQKTAVAPIVEVRDRNNVPVAGATVTFSVSGKGASFGASGSSLTVTTNGAGQATAAGLTPSAAGTVQINVTAAFQGLSAAAATITQTVFATAAQAAAAGAGAGVGAAGAGAGGGAAAAGGGLSLTTIGLIGAAAAGGAVVAQQAGVIGGADGFIMIKGVVYSTIRFGGVCTVPAGGPGHIPPPAECLGPAVAGAVVSTTLDNATATTDGAGNFDLTTTLPRSRIEECLTYTITIAAAGHPTYTVNTRGFSGNQQGNEVRQYFALSPPTPSFMSGC
jgi:hypothetical protein